MKLIDLKKQTKKIISECKIEDGDGKILELLFEHAFSFSRNFLLTENNYEIDEHSSEYKLYLDDIDALKRCVPIQHIVGYADFCSLKFKVSEDVLIPRQETELLVKIALYRLKNTDIKMPSVLDLCSGSGGIGISVKKYFPAAKVTLSDISEKALSISMENAGSILGAKGFVSYLKGDFLEPAISAGLKFDMVLSNPPYIKTSELPTLPKNVFGHDPDLALDGGNSGIVPYERIIPRLPLVLNENGIVAFEIGETQGEQIKELLLREKCFNTIEIVKDLCGCDRFVCAKYNEIKKKNGLSPNASVGVLHGIGKKGLEALSSMGVNTVSDLISFYPKKYENRTVIKTISEGKFEPKTPATYKLVIKNISFFGMYGKKVISVSAFDKTGGIKIAFFNMPYVSKDLAVGAEYYFYGAIEKADTSYPELVNPKFVLAKSENANAFLKIIPVYRQRNSIRRDKILTAVKEALSSVPSPADISEALCKKYNIISKKSAVCNIHFPENLNMLVAAQNRILFDELLKLSVTISLSKQERDECAGNGFRFMQIDTDPLRGLLPYKLTLGQESTISEIYKDMEASAPMNRLVIGDVGSGKTVIALFAIYKAIKNNKQAAFMVPSTVLAEQHYQKLKPMLSALGINTYMLLGSTKASERKPILEKLSTGEPMLLIGTHSLIQEKVVFSNLGLVVTDEQHRFGVNQRKKLIGNYDTIPDVLLLTATPIPRTLALVIYGDMDISYLKEKPSGRIEVSTSLVTNRSRKAVYSKALSYVNRGEQVFIVHSCIEDPEEELDFDENEVKARLPKSCISNHNELSKSVFSGVRTAVLHGKMKDEEKNEIMRKFAAHEIDILFSTTVIEVGIDIKNASLMIIENAERFGLSQLHQLRGRVGRGSNASECILISDNANESKRLNVMVHESDGFKIAEEDLKIRGPGELLGTEQSGLNSCTFANPLSSPQLVTDATNCAKEIITLFKADKSSPEANFVNQMLLESGRIIL